jgi:hypothetical protein
MVAVKNDVVTCNQINDLVNMVLPGQWGINW